MKKKRVTAEDFVLFLQRHEHSLPQNSVPIMDNASIQRARGITVIFLPPYSPFLNPIEFAFSKIKGGVKGDDFQNREDLLQSVERHTATITAEDAAGCFRHINRYNSNEKKQILWRVVMSKKK